jgi:hypothetical protein
VTAAWVRSHYGVPAYRGGRVAYTGDEDKGRQLGTIVGFPDSHLRIRLDGQRHTIITHPTWELEYLPKAEWVLTEANVHELWDQDVIRVHCKPHYAPAPAGYHVSTVVDGLTIHPHKGLDRQVAYLGDTIRLDHAGRYTVHPATQETQR